MEKDNHIESQEITFDKETKIYDREKAASSKIGAGKTGQLHVKE